MLVPTGVKYQPTPNARSDTPAELPKLLTLMPTWPGSTREQEVSGTMTTRGTSKSGAKRIFLFMFPTPEDEVELAAERRGEEIPSHEPDEGEQRGAAIGEVAVQVEQGGADECEAGDFTHEERPASQSEPHEPQ